MSRRPTSNPRDRFPGVEKQALCRLNYEPGGTSYELSIDFHAITLLLRIQIWPLLLDPLDKLIHHARPRAILAPEPDIPILQRTLRKHQRLVPHILVDRPLALVPQKLRPQREPVGLRRAGVIVDLRVPVQGLRGEEHGPEGDGGVDVERAGGRGLEELEGVAVDAFEHVAGGGGGDFGAADLNGGSLAVGIWGAEVNSAI